jgi:hypothetical protein
VGRRRISDSRFAEVDADEDLKFVRIWLSSLIPHAEQLSHNAAVKVDNSALLVRFFHQFQPLRPSPSYTFLPVPILERILHLPISPLSESPSSFSPTQNQTQGPTVSEPVIHYYHYYDFNSNLPTTTTIFHQPFHSTLHLSSLSLPLYSETAISKYSKSDLYTQTH